MNQDTLEGKWRRFKGDLRAKWGKLTDDEIESAKGNTDKMLGLIQEKYGLARGKAKEELEKLEKSLED